MQCQPRLILVPVAWHRQSTAAQVYEARAIMKGRGLQKKRKPLRVAKEAIVLVFPAIQPFCLGLNDFYPGGCSPTPDWLEWISPLALGFCCGPAFGPPPWRILSPCVRQTRLQRAWSPAQPYPQLVSCWSCRIPVCCRYWRRVLSLCAGRAALLMTCGIEILMLKWLARNPAP
jgi:hypothetical protein